MKDLPPATAGQIQDLPASSRGEFKHG